jgi:hypothetical protein
MRQITIPDNSRRALLARSVPRHTLRTTTLSSSATMSSIVTWMSGNFLYAPPTYCLAPCGPGGIAEGTSVPWSTNSGAKCTTAMLRFCWIDELAKMIAYKGLHFGVSHLRLGIHGFWVGGRCLPEHGQGWAGRQSPQPQSSPRWGLWRLLPANGEKVVPVLLYAIIPGMRNHPRFRKRLLPESLHHIVGGFNLRQCNVQ